MITSAHVSDVRHNHGDEAKRRVAGAAIEPDGEAKGRRAMKVAASVTRRCERCKVIKREGVIRVICTNPRHKQRQG